MNKKFLILLAVIFSVGFVGIFLKERDKEFPLGASEATIVQVIQQSQDKYFTKNGTYWQGLKQFAKPSDRAEAWVDMTAAELAYDLIVNTYNGPQGQGYEVRFEYPDPLGKRVKIYNFGPETHRAKEYIQLPFTI